MCMVALLLKVVDGFPVVLAANREEQFDRQGTPPERWNEDPAFVAGRDPKAGGTWLGVNQLAIIAAVTNRPKQQVPAGAPSRGLLCRELLRYTSADDAHRHAVQAIAERAYAGCNILVIEKGNAFVVEAGDEVQSTQLVDGIHIVTARGLNCADDARAAYARQRLSRLHFDFAGDWMHAVARLCGEHGERAPICLHGPTGGTISSSIIALASDSQRSKWLHAQGPPCRTPFVDCSPLLRNL